MSALSDVVRQPTTEHSVLFRGDVPPAVQKHIVEFSNFHLKDVAFARSTGQQLVLKEASIFRRTEDKKSQSKLVYEITVGQGTSDTVELAVCTATDTQSLGAAFLP